MEIGAPRGPRSRNRGSCVDERKGSVGANRKRGKELRVSRKKQAQAMVPTLWNRMIHAVPIDRRELVCGVSGRDQSRTRQWEVSRRRSQANLTSREGLLRSKSIRYCRADTTPGTPEGVSSERWMIEPMRMPRYLNGTAEWFKRLVEIATAEPQLFIPTDANVLGCSTSDRPKGRIESRFIGEPIPVPILDPMGMAFPWRWAEALIC